MSEYFELEKHGKKYLISARNDRYGISFWRNFSSMNYEPDTQALLQVFCDSDTIFMDIGAANGSMSILAASLGAKVWAYEPNPHIFQSLHFNVNLNPSLVDNVELINKAVSVDSGSISMTSSNLSDVLTPIVFTDWSLQNSIEVVSIIEELDRCGRFNPKSKIVIKMDVEGAEWLILTNSKVLHELKRRNVILILALHPGLQRPITRGTNLLFRIKSLIWNVRNSIDSYKLYCKLYELSIIKRTNLNLVRRPMHFCLLVLGGNHEYVIDFRTESSK